MGRDTVIHAQIEAQNCTAELYLNGIPVSRIHPQRMYFESVAVEEHLLPGRNRLELLIEPGSHPSVARTEARYLELADATAVGRLVRFRDNVLTDADNGDLLCEVTFARAKEMLGPYTIPMSLSCEADLGQANGRWAWQDAPVLDLDDALMAEAAAMLDEIGAAYQALSADALWALVQINIQESLRAYPALTEAKLRDDLQKILANYAKSPDRVVPRAVDQHDFRLVAGGRILECVDRDYMPSLRLRSLSRPEGIPFAVMLSRIGGRLRLVR